MWVYDTKVIESNTKVKLAGVWGGQEATVLNYNEGTYPVTYTVELANGTTHNRIPHNVVRPA